MESLLFNKIQSQTDSDIECKYTHGYINRWQKFNYLLELNEEFTEQIMQ